jgi:hypothetical protein
VDDGAATAVGSFRIDEVTSGRGASGEQGVDLAPATATRPGEDGLVVLRREVLAEQTDGGYGQRARGEQVEDHWEATASPRGVDAIARRVLGQS